MSHIRIYLMFTRRCKAGTMRPSISKASRTASQDIRASWSALVNAHDVVLCDADVSASILTEQSWSYDLHVTWTTSSSSS